MLLDIRQIKPGSLIKLGVNYDCDFATRNERSITLKQNAVFMFLGYEVYPATDPRISFSWFLEHIIRNPKDIKSLLFMKLLVDSRTREIFITGIPDHKADVFQLPEDFYDANYFVTTFAMANE